MGANVRQGLVDAYRAPRLTVYGSMVELTASGTGTACESNAQGITFPTCGMGGGGSSNKRP